MEMSEWKEIVDKLAQYIPFPETPVGLKWYEHREDCLAISKIRTAKKHHTTCQIIWQSITNRWTLAILPENTPMRYCA